MGARGKNRIRRTHRLSTIAAVGVVLTAGTLQSSNAGAARRQTLIATTASPGSEGVLLALGVGVLVLGGIGIFLFTRARRKRRPSQCADQRDALELAERAVRYWDTARAHLEAVERERMLVDGASVDEPAHASLVAKAVDGMNTAVEHRDQCQMDLIRCMASGVPAAPVITPTSPDAQPYLTPRNDGPMTSGPSTNQ